MRWAIVSDIHANAVAMRNVLADIASRRIDRTICLGDIAGYGPEPSETVELVRKNIDICLSGNHDAAVAGIRGTADFQPIAALAAARHKGMLDAADLKWLAVLPLLHVQKSVAGRPAFACTHGDFTNPAAFNYIIDARDAAASWIVREEPLLFVGHTHDPCVFILGNDGLPRPMPPVDFTLREGCRYIVNPGSAGYPRHGACASSYCIYDDEIRAVEFRFLPFDLEGYAARMEKNGMRRPRWVTHLLEESAAGRASAAKQEPGADGKSASAPSTAAETEKKRSGGMFAFTCIACAVAVATGAAFAIRAAVRAVDGPAPEETVVARVENSPAKQGVAVPPQPEVPAPPEASAPAVSLQRTIQTNGWTVVCISGENPSADPQKDGKWILTAAGEAEFLLERRIELNGARKVKASAQAYRKNEKKYPAEIRAELEFFDANGVRAGDVFKLETPKAGGGKRSFQAPPDAVAARLRVRAGIHGKCEFKMLQLER